MSGHGGGLGTILETGEYDDADQVLSALPGHPVVLVGRGGRAGMALEVAARAPDLVERVVLVSPSPSQMMVRGLKVPVLVLDVGEGAPDVPRLGRRHPWVTRTVAPEQVTEEIERPAPEVFDPFLSIPGGERFGAVRTWPLLLGWPVGLAVLVAVTAAEGTLGSRADIRQWPDLLTMVGLRDGPTPASFPLLRDFSSLLIVSVVCLTVPLIHGQWRRMGEVVPVLLHNGVLRPKDAELNALLRGVGSFFLRLRRLFWVFVVISALAAFLVVHGARANGVFAVLAGRVSPGERDLWMDQAYHSWWAGSGHPVGAVLYYAFLSFGILLVVAQSWVGLVAVQVLFALRSVADLDLDWFDQDGDYGWDSVATAYRTVVVAVVLHTSTLSVALVALGLRNLTSAMVVIVLWLIMAPYAVLGPVVALRGVSRKAQEHRVAELVAESAGQSIQEQEETRRAIQGIRKAAAHPLRVRRREVPAVFVAIVFPLLLTVAQIYASIV